MKPQRIPLTLDISLPTQSLSRSRFAPLATPQTHCPISLPLCNTPRPTVTPTAETPVPTLDQNSGSTDSDNNGSDSEPNIPLPSVPEELTHTDHAIPLPKKKPLELRRLASFNAEGTKGLGEYSREQHFALVIYPS